MKRADIERLAAQALPVMGFTSSSLQQMQASNVDRINVSDIANVVLHDPLLVFQLLRHIARLDRVRTLAETASVEHALMLVGVDPFFADFASARSLDHWPGATSAHKHTVAALLARGRLAAMLAKEWLSKIEEYRVEEYFTAALLYNVPLALYAIDHDVSLEGGVERAALRAVGDDYTLFSRELFAAAGLPAELIERLFSQHDLSRNRLLLRHAITVANHVCDGWWLPKVQDHLRAAADLLVVPVEQTWHSLVTASLALARAGYTRAYADPARVLPLEAQAPLVSEHEFLHLDWQNDTGNAEAAFGLEVCNVLRNIVGVADCDRTVFFQFDAGEDALLSRYHIGVERSAGLIDIRIPVHEGSFFAAFAAKPQAFRCQPEQFAALKARYPHPFWDHVADSGFVLMSVLREGRLAGLIYADRQPRLQAVDDAAYTQIKSAAHGLSH